MKTNTIIRVLSVILALVIFISAAVPTILYGIGFGKWDYQVLRNVSQVIEANTFLCPLYVLAYLIYVFIFRGGDKGVMLKTLLLIVGVYLASGIAVGIVPLFASVSVAATYIRISISFVLSLIVWAICAAVNTAVQEKKKSK